MSLRAVSLGEVRYPGSKLAKVLGLVLLGGTLACNSVSPDDLVGTWSMTEASRRNLPTEIANVAPRFTFNSDGTLTAVEYPRRDLRGARWAPFSGRGTWTIKKVAGTGDVQLRFEDNFGDQLWVSQLPGSPMSLYFSVGDPDSGHQIHFTRSR